MTHAKRSRVLRNAWVLKLLRGSVAPAIGGALLLLASPAAANIAVNTVTDEFGTGVDCSLREAIQVINTGADFGGCVYDTDAAIDLPDGVYTLTIAGAIDDTNATGDLDLSGGVVIYGTGKPEVNGNDLDRVFHVLAGGILIIGGGVDDGPDHGLLITNGSVTNDSGGGIRADGSLYLKYTDVTNNAVISGGYIQGGGIAAFADLHVDHCTVTGNTITGTDPSADAAIGGGIAVGGDGVHVISNSTISNNTATGILAVGGIASKYDVEISNTTISGNSGALASGIGMVAATLTLTDSTVASNEGGPAITHKYGDPGPFNIDGSTITANDGGGLSIGETSTATVTNSTFSGNGTALAFAGAASADLSHVTITGNTEGIDSTSLNVQVKSSIVSGNTTDCSAAYITSVGQNVFGDGGTCPAIGSDVDDGGATADVISATLAANGGATMTHALVSGSIAMDLAADCENIGGGAVTVDQRDVARPLGVTCDAGAIESLPTGEACTSGAECANGNCVDMVCCGEATCPECHSCNVAGDLGSCIPDASKAGDDCGSSSNTACDNADTCDASGNCDINAEPEGTECGSDNETECSAADSCDGAGECSSNDEEDGAACTDGECEAGDCVEGAGMGGAGGADSGEGGEAPTGKGGSSGKGGKGGGTSSNAGAGGDEPAPAASSDSEDDGGCGCTVPGKDPVEQRGFLALALAAVGLIGRRKRQNAA